MNAVRAGLGVVLAAALPMVISPMRCAEADIADIALNGTYRATSDGTWAKTNERYRAEATVVSRPVLTALAGGGEPAVEAWLTALVDGIYAMTAWMGAEHPSRLAADQLLRA